MKKKVYLYPNKNENMITEMVLIGLVSEICGVIILVHGAHIGHNDVLRYLGRTVPNDWDDKVKKFKNQHIVSTFGGIAFLFLGFLLQYYGLLWLGQNGI